MEVVVHTVLIENMNILKMRKSVNFAHHLAMAVVVHIAQLKNIVTEVVIINVAGVEAKALAQVAHIAHLAYTKSNLNFSAQYILKG